MSTEAVLTVRGEATLYVAPEIAVVSAGLEIRDRDRRAALASLAERYDELDGIVRGFEDAVEKVEQSPVMVRPEFRKDDPREPVVGYVAGTSLTATVRDFTVLSDLVVTLAGRDSVTMAGPWWQLRADSPAYRRARIAAARDASTRVRDYAEAYGGRVVRLLELADTGLIGPNGSAGWRMQTAVAKPMRGGNMGEVMGGIESEIALTFNFEPVEQTIHANVEARFAVDVPPAEGFEV